MGNSKNGMPTEQGIPYFQNTSHNYFIFFSRYLLGTRCVSHHFYYKKNWSMSLCLVKPLALSFTLHVKHSKKFPFVKSMDIPFTKRRKLMPILKSRRDVMLYRSLIWKFIHLTLKELL
jgi:hypothetical protein